MPEIKQVNKKMLHYTTAQLLFGKKYRAVKNLHSPDLHAVYSEMFPEERMLFYFQFPTLVKREIILARSCGNELTWGSLSFVYSGLLCQLSGSPRRTVLVVHLPKTNYFYIGPHCQVHILCLRLL